jgi:hypothetical protein
MAENSERTTGKHGPGRPFRKGVCPNPSGRPKMPDEIREAFRALAPESLEALKRIMQSEDTKDNDRIRAIEIILNRGYGTPVQSIELGNKDGDPFNVMSLTYQEALQRVKALRLEDESKNQSV